MLRLTSEVLITFVSLQVEASHSDDDTTNRRLRSSLTDPPPTGNLPMMHLCCLLQSKPHWRLRWHTHTHTHTHSVDVWHLLVVTGRTTWTESTMSQIIKYCWVKMINIFNPWRVKNIFTVTNIKLVVCSKCYRSTEALRVKLERGNGLLLFVFLCGTAGKKFCQ